MGNVEVMNQSERKPIFNKSYQEGRKTSKSPKMQTIKPEDTQRKHRDNRAYRVRDFQQTNRYDKIRKEPAANGFSGRIIKNKQQQTVEPVYHNNNKGGTGNRVSNFNDFMIELKKQLNDNSANTYQNSVHLQQTLRNGENTRQILKHNSSRELVMNLKLQNQRLELEKYKRLVERQLSKNHSIEKISLESKKQNQQVLTIKYDDFMNNGNKRKYEQTQQHNLIQFKENNNNQLAQKIAYEKRLYEQTYEKAKEVFAELSKRTYNLQLFLANNDRPLVQQTGFYKDKCNTTSWQQKGTITKNIGFELTPSCRAQQQEAEPSEERISKISSLFQQIDHIHNDQVALQRNIRAAIGNNDDSESDCSGKFSSRQQTLQKY